MTGMTKGLKVLLVVEKGSVSLVWNDVVDVCRHHDLPFFEALLTVGMLSDESVSQLLPSVRVTAGVRIACDLYALLLSPLGGLSLGIGVTFGTCLLVPIAVTVASWHRAVTPWIRTDSQQWHMGT